MFEVNNLIYIDGKSLDIKKLSIEELKEYLNKFEEMQKITIDEQNQYLSEIL